MEAKHEKKTVGSVGVLVISADKAEKGQLKAHSERQTGLGGGGFLSPRQGLRRPKKAMLAA